MTSLMPKIREYGGCMSIAELFSGNRYGLAKIDFGTASAKLRSSFQPLTDKKLHKLNP